MLNSPIKHGLFFPDDRQVEPDSLTQGLLKRCGELGVEIHEHTPVRRFLRQGDTVTGVLTDKGEYRGDNLLLVGGVWTARMTPSSVSPCRSGRARVTASTTLPLRCRCARPSRWRTPGSR
ncbi:NAD(P)/FAD-dependent oxidoreductase [Streptomyces sp. NBC_01518]|uniref:NAD(P)/FAD-dependent oxidoreductase n=1 Tax=Streptomyces sp. NBC_01518 TaxID=2903891 RepID=UPI003864F652